MDELFSSKMQEKSQKSRDFGDYYVNQGGWLDTSNESDGVEGDAPLSTFGFICEWSD